ncbi:MAG: hypothetical protein WCF16_08165 [Alphaproteobacteria bacterium]
MTAVMPAGSTATLAPDQVRLLERRIVAVEDHVRQLDRILRRALEIAARYLEGGGDDETGPSG